MPIALALVALLAVAVADAEHPVVVELFTAQGCAACPPAQAAVNALAGRDDVLPLSFSVTYWDRFGWRDRFARPLFTERQRTYARLGRRDLATPQVLLNGTFAVTGGDRAALDRAIVAADRGGRGPAIAATATRLRVGADRGSARAATVWLVSYDPREQQVPIAAGQNRGRTLPHRNVVTALERLGSWSGGAATYRLPRVGRTGWRRAVLVQSADGGTIVAARRIG